MTEKQKYLKEYINNLAISLNKQYRGILSPDKVQKAYDMFKDSPKSLPEIIEEIDELKNNVIEEYLIRQKQQSEIGTIKLSEEKTEKFTSDQNQSKGQLQRQLETEELEELKRRLTGVQFQDNVNTSIQNQPANNPETFTEQQSATNSLEKGKQKTIGTYPKKNATIQDNGYINGFMLSLIIGFILGSIFMVAYLVLNMGKYTFII